MEYFIVHLLLLWTFLLYISSLWKNSHDVGVVDAAVVVFRLSWQVTRR